MKILLIAGGWSSEREISLRGAKEILQALIELGHDVTLFDVAENKSNTILFDMLLTTASEHDFAFINLHGAPGEDGLIQAMLEHAGCPYQGSSPQALFWHSLKPPLNNAFAVQIFLRLNGFLPTPPEAGWAPNLPYPLFVKANNGGSSLHLARVEDEEALFIAMDAIFNAGCEVLIEPCISGVELTCAVLGEKALPPIMILPKSGTFFDYDTKHTKDATQEICPAPISATLTQKMQEITLKAHKLLGLKGYSRRFYYG